MNKKDACITLNWYGYPDLTCITPNASSSTYRYGPYASRFIYTWTMPDSRFQPGP